MALHIAQVLIVIEILFESNSIHNIFYTKIDFSLEFPLFYKENELKTVSFSGFED